MNQLKSVHPYPFFYKFAGLAISLSMISACDPSSASRVNRSPAVGSIQSNSSAVIGKACEGSTEDILCIGLKYVVYQDAQGQPVSDESSALSNLEGINRVWDQCGIAFQIEKYEVVNPFDAGLAFEGLASESQNFEIRKMYEEDNTFLVVTTGKWNSWKNAWTASPGVGPYGAVMEGSIATGYSEIYAHELGHYLNLDHVDSRTNVMSPTIGHASLRLSPSQCEIARQTATQFWPNMLR